MAVKPAVLRAKREAVKVQGRKVVALERELENAREDLTELQGDLSAAEEGKADPEDDETPEPDDGDIHRG